jgi:PAS domain S-box-containing protein
MIPCYTLDMPTRRRLSELNKGDWVCLVAGLVTAVTVAVVTRVGASGWLHVYAPFTLGAIIWLAITLVTLRRMGQARAEVKQRARHLMALSAIGEAMRGDLDLPKLLEAIHEQVNPLLDARSFYIALYDADTHQISFPLCYENGEQCHPKPRQAGDSLAGHVIQTRQPLLIREQLSHAAAQLGVELPGRSAQSWLGVPILTDNQVLGVIAVQSQTLRAYDTSQQELLATVAAQATMAIRNAQLYSTLHQSTAEFAILNSVSTAIGATLDLERVLEIITTSIGPFIGCSKSAIFLLDDASDELHLARSQGLSSTYIGGAHRLKVKVGGDGMVAAPRQPLVVPDVTTAPGFETLAPAAQAEGIRALAEVPLMAQNTLIGTLAVYFADPHTFTQAEMDLLGTFANQAAIAVNNARLYARTDQALARRVEELSALEEIGRELAGTLDMARITDRILERTMEIAGAQMGSIVLMDEDSHDGRFVAQHGYSRQKIAPYLQRPWPLTQGIIGRVLRTGQLANVPDVRLDPDYIPADPNVQSQLSAPITREGRALGVITLESHRPAAFDQVMVAFVQQLANQAAIAIENARLFSDRMQRIHELAQLYEASLALTGSLDLRQVLDRIATAAHQLSQADGATLHLYDSASDEFLPGAVAGISLPGDSVSGIRPQGMTRRALQQRQPILVGDTRADPDANWRIVAAGVRSLICVPVISHDQVLGVLNAFSQQPHKFTDADLHLVSALANQAAAAIENARLFQAVAESHDKLRAILNSSREGVLMFDLAGRVAMANPSLERLLGISRAEIEGQPLTTLLGKPELDIAAQLGYSPPVLLALLDELRQSQRPIETHHTFQLTRPSARFVERSGAPVLDTSGGLVGWMITVRDVTEERDLQRMRDDLASMIIHDLRSPLSAIVSGLYLLRDMLPTSGDSELWIETISASERSCLKLLDLVNTLLDISKMEAGRMEITPQPVNLDRLVANALNRLALLAQSREIVVTSHVDGSWQVLADEEKLGRVFINLVDNALKFTPANGQVTILAERAPGEVGFVRCAVCDTGPGIRREYHERIFDRFAQAPDERGKQRGTGLGLTFCKLMVEAHGGRIWVESEEGRGSAFYFTLPLSEQ